MLAHAPFQIEGQLSGYSLYFSLVKESKNV